MHCAYCGSTEQLTVDHVVPLIMGGDNTDANKQTLCWPCHRRKGQLEKRVMAELSGTGSWRDYARHARSGGGLYLNAGTTEGG